MVLALASVASAAPFTYLTINGEALDAITLRTGQVCTVGVVSTTSNEYEANVGFDDHVVLGIFYKPRVMFKAGGQASIIEVDKPTFYGYHAIAEGYFPPPSPGVHFTIEYEPNQVGETDLKLYSEGFDSLIDSVHITIVSGDMGTAFTYQGRLMEDGNPADGLHDFQFRLYNDANTFIGNQLGNTIDINDLDVIDGYFTVELDFNSPSAFNGYARWLQIDVRPGEMSDPCKYTILSPRQEVTPTPYALYAKNAHPDNDWMISGNDMYSVPSGNVGIGTSTPESRLHVNQTVGAWGEGIRLSYGDHAWDLITDTNGERLLIVQDQIINRGLAIKNGDIGIGETSPLTTLHVQGTDRALHDALSGDDIIAEDWTAILGLYSDDRASYGSGITLGEFVGDTGTLTNKWGIYRMTGTSPALQFSFGTEHNFTANPTRLTITAGGGVGIGTTSPGLYKLNVQGGSSGIYVSGSTRAGHFEDADGTSLVELAYGNYGIWADGQRHYFTGSVGIGNSIPQAELDVSGKIMAQEMEVDGTTTTDELVIMGGSDLSEQFDIKGAEDTVKPGMLVSIDPTRPGKLLISNASYDKKVAGIISGAGGVKPGMLMGQKGTMADGEHPVALTGRVYCWADASNGAIEPGDLLTTSSTPGHAMKVSDHNKALGAIVGKAMTSLKEGKGLVLVLVNLQ